MTKAILLLCSEQPRTLADLSQLIGRSVDSLRVHYVSNLVQSGQLRLLYPDSPHDPRQGYVVAR